MRLQYKVAVVTLHHPATSIVRYCVLIANDQKSYLIFEINDSHLDDSSSALPNPTDISNDGPACPPNNVTAAAKPRARQRRNGHVKDDEPPRGLPRPQPDEGRWR